MRDVPRGEKPLHGQKDDGDSFFDYAKDSFATKVRNFDESEGNISSALYSRSTSDSFHFISVLIMRSALLLLPWRFCRRPARTRGAARGNTPLRRGEWRHTPFCELLRYNFFLGRSPSRVPLCGFVFWCPLGRVGFFC